MMMMWKWYDGADDEGDDDNNDQYDDDDDDDDIAAAAAAPTAATNVAFADVSLYDYGDDDDDDDDDDENYDVGRSYRASVLIAYSGDCLCHNETILY